MTLNAIGILKYCSSIAFHVCNEYVSCTLVVENVDRSFFDLIFLWLWELSLVLAPCMSGIMKKSWCNQPMSVIFIRIFVVPLKRCVKINEISHIYRNVTLMEPRSTFTTKESGKIPGRPAGDGFATLNKLYNSIKFIFSMRKDRIVFIYKVWTYATNICNFQTYYVWNMIVLYVNIEYFTLGSNKFMLTFAIMLSFSLWMKLVLDNISKI